MRRMGCNKILGPAVVGRKSQDSPCWNHFLAHWEDVIRGISRDYVAARQGSDFTPRTVSFALSLGGAGPLQRRILLICICVGRRLL